MRFLLAAFAALASLVSVPASAQSLGDLLGISRSATNSANSFRYDSCVYERGVFKAVCQAQRIADTADRAGQLRRQYDDARRRSATTVRLNDPDAGTMVRIQAMCSQGSDQACALVKQMRRDGTSARIDVRQQAMTPQEQRAAAAYERARAEMRGETYAAPSNTTLASAGGYRTAPDYTTGRR